MSHIHDIIDTDKRFYIKPSTRVIKKETSKVKLMQYDHNAERFGFEMPRFVEGHDMSICDRVEIHYINFATPTEKSEDVYLVDDMQVSPCSDKMVFFSWLISANATKYAGPLVFLIRFVCLDGEKVTYSWGTEPFRDIKIGEGIDNSAAAIEMSTDVLEAWRKEVLGGSEEAAKKAEAAANRAESAANRADRKPHIGANGNWWVGTDDTGVKAQGENGVGIESIERVDSPSVNEKVQVYEITLTDGRTKTFSVTNGKDGEQGMQGDGISSIKKTKTEGLVDTYTITLTNGNTETFTVTNGKDGEGVSEESLEQIQNELNVIKEELDEFTPYILYANATIEDYERAVSLYDYGARVSFVDENGNACPSIGLVDDGIRFLKQDTFEVIELKFEDGELKVTYLPLGNSPEDSTYIDLWSDSVISEFLHADDCFKEPNVIIEYAYSVEGEAGDTYCRYLGRAKDKDGYVSGFRFLDAKHLRIVTVWFATPTSAQKLEFTSLTDDYITITGQSTRAELLNAINSPKQAVFVDHDGQLCYAINETSSTAHFFNASTNEIIYFNVEDFIDEAEVLGRGIRTPLGVESIWLDEESTADDITNAINAYRTYGTNVFFETNGADYGTLVAFKERPQKVLYFVTSNPTTDVPSVIMVKPPESGHVIEPTRMEIVNRENIVHTVMTVGKMNTIINNATEEDIGICYLFCGTTTTEYTYGAIYIIGDKNIDGARQFVFKKVFDTGVDEALKLDSTLTQEGKAADAKVVGDRLKLEGRVTPQMYKENGDADDTLAFQKALQNNRCVYVPSGTYTLSGELLIRDNCELTLAQDAVLNFTQTSGNCISMKMCSSIMGHHATINVPYGFTGNVICVSSALNDSESGIPPWSKWDPQWKTGRYIKDINICKADSRGFHYSVDGDCCGTAIYISADGSAASSFIWGLNFSGIRIAGAFIYGIKAINFNSGWNHEMRIEAFIDACETSVSLEDCNNAYLSIVIQPRRAYTLDKVYKPYAKCGIELIRSKRTDLHGSRVWDWNASNTLWAYGGECQHIVMKGDCTGTVLDDFMYWASSGYDIRELIYTDKPENLEKMTIIQEPITRWFKPIDKKPHFYDGDKYNQLITREDLDAHFVTQLEPDFLDVLAAATDEQGNIFNGIGYLPRGGRVNASDGVFKETSAYGCTGYIRCDRGDDIHFSDISLDLSQSDGYCSIVLFNDKFERIISHGFSHILGGNNSFFVYEQKEYGFAITVRNVADNNGTTYMRVTFRQEDFGAKPAAARNEEISYVTAGYLSDRIKVDRKAIAGLKEDVTVISTESTDNQTPTAKAVYTALNNALGAYVNDIAALIGGDA